MTNGGVWLDVLIPPEKWEAGEQERFQTALFAGTEQRVPGKWLVRHRQETGFIPETGTRIIHLKLTPLDATAREYCAKCHRENTL